MKQHSEQQIQRQIRDWLNLHGYVRKIHTTGIPDGHGGFRKNPSSGVSDLVGVIRIPCPTCERMSGRFVAVEVKAPGQIVKPGSEQDKYLRASRDAGGIAVWAHSVEECDAMIKAQLREEQDE